MCFCILVSAIRHVNRVFSAYHCIVGYVGPVWLYHIFPHYLINGTILGKTVLKIKFRVLIFSTAFYWNISHSEINLASYYHKRAEVFTKNNIYSCHIIMTLEFSRQIKKNTMSNLMKILSVGAELFHEDRRRNGRTDGRTERVWHNEADINSIYVCHFFFLLTAIIKELITVKHN